MASLIPEYEYDIFISYRQKDNKHDGWVTEFVKNLKGELESAFKEEVSVYFDINPHDGLLETHDVDATLKNKLKCLVFIPVISRTYCDPNSFAWEHEFKAFVEQASQDQFGLKVKLSNGNVASRVLPVCIYDLDNSDIELCESILDSVLRGVEFIYKSAGVNRPLRANEDHPQDNLNKTYYRDQINKVANAIREIIRILEHNEKRRKEVSDGIFKPLSVTGKSNKTKIITTSVILLALLILGIFIVPKLYKSPEQIEKSIAVLPFANLSDDPEQDYFSDGMVDEILDHLFKIGDLKVISRTSSMRYKGTRLTLKQIARELGVSAILEGSVRKIGNNVRITVQLIDARTDTHLWSESYDGDLSDVFSFQSAVAQNVARELKATMTSEAQALIEKRNTKNSEAYNLYLQGRFFLNKRTKEGMKKSIEYFEKSVSIDPDYALAYAGLADAYFILTWWGWSSIPEGYIKAKEYTLRALAIDNNLAEAHTTLGGLMTYSDWNWEGARKELLFAIELNPNYATAHHYYSELLDIIRQNDAARAEINKALELDPYLPVMRGLSALYYYHENKLKESLNESRKLQELFPDYIGFYGTLFNIYIRTGKNINAMETLQKIMLLDSIDSKYVNVVKDIYNKTGMKSLLNWLITAHLNETDSYDLATWNAMLGKKEETIFWLGKALEEHFPAIPRINNNPDFDIVRSDPGFQEIINKMVLSEYSNQ